MSRLWRAVRARAGLAFATILCAVVLGLLEGSSLWLLIPALQQFQLPDPAAADRLRTLVAGIGLLVLGRAAAGYGYQVLASRLRLGILVDLRQALLAGLHRARAEELEALGPGRIVNLVSTQTERMVDAVAAVTALTRAAILLLVYGTAVFLLSPAMIGWLLLLGVLLLAAHVLISRQVRQHASRFLRAEADWSRLLLDDVEGWRQIRVFGVEDQRFRLHQAVHRQLAGVAAALQRWRDAANPAREVLVTGVVAGVALFGLGVGPGGVAGGLPGFIFFLVALLRINGQLGVVGDAWAALAEQAPAAGEAFALARDPAGPAADRAVPDTGVPTAVSLEQVDFAYPGGPPVLENLSLRLEPGELTALVGATGAGKSTLAQLLVLLRSPQRGRIQLDRRRSATAIVFQDDFIFDESLLWNVTLGRAAESSRIEQAMAVTGLDGTAPDRRLGSRGSVLSGGQRQRVALARALLLDPEVLILDEATSALDGQAERELLDRLREARSGRVTLIISHRLSAVCGADRVLFLEGGVIVAEGTHGQLLEASAAYRRLFESQVAGAAV